MPHQSSDAVKCRSKSFSACDGRDTIAVVEAMFGRERFEDTRASCLIYSLMACPPVSLEGQWSRFVRADRVLQSARSNKMTRRKMRTGASTIPEDSASKSQVVCEKW